MKHPTKLVGARMRACRSWQACSFAILTQQAHARKGIGTMAVDKHWRLYYDPEFVAKTPVDELAGVLLHETAHLLLTHHKRFRSDMDHDLWNVAADLAINSMLTSAGIKLPTNGLFPKDHGLPDGKSAEWYYRELSQKQEQESESESQDEQDDTDDDDQSQTGGDEPPPDSDDQEDSDEGQSQGDDDESEEPQSDSQETDSGDQESDSGDADQGSQDGAGDEPSDGDGDGDPAESDSEPQGDGTPQDDQEYEPAQGCGGSCADGQTRPWEIDGVESQDEDGGLDEDDAQELIRQTAERIEQAGKGVGNLSSFCDEILRPKIDPKRLLLHAIRSATDNLISGGDGRFSYRRPARRPSITACLRPRSFTPVPKIKVLIDTSGSMGERDYQLSLGLVAKCLNSLRLRDGIHIVTGDTRAAWAGKVFDHSKINLVGGGGTDMDIILKSMAEEKRDKPDLIICCTDGFTGWPDKPIGIPVVACVTREPSQWYKIPTWITHINLAN